jgi:hemoglobin
MRIPLNPCLPASRCLGFLAVILISTSCSTGTPKEQQEPFFTSGSREADQRASQRMTKEEQIAESSEGSSKRDKENGKPTGEEAKPEEKRLTLYERLGGNRGITAIVDDFTARVMEDPRVNWERGGMMRGPVFFRREQPPAWTPTPENIAALKKHMAQFFALATGGPADYDGKDLSAVHEEMRITNPEFDAAAGDLKATLDRLNIADREQKELLAIVESTRPQVVTVR